MMQFKTVNAPLTLWARLAGLVNPQTAAKTIDTSDLADEEVNHAVGGGRNPIHPS